MTTARSLERRGLRTLVLHGAAGYRCADSVAGVCVRRAIAGAEAAGLLDRRELRQHREESRSGRQARVERRRGPRAETTV